MSELVDNYIDVAYLRVASMAVGAYELVITLPAEYRFYRQQVLRHSISQQFVLFILIRYLSIAVVVISNVGFFGRFPSIEACRRFMLVSPVFKALQTLVSQLIIASRTYSISRRSRWVLWTMMVTFGVTAPTQFYSNISGRMPVYDSTLRNCISGNATTYRIAWVHYLDAMIFDVVAICISTGYLWLYRSTATRISHFVRTLLYEGLGYFAVLTAVNIFNLVLYLRESEATQSSGASLGYVIIFIMSQRILIRQRDYANKYAAAALPSTTTREIPISRRLDTTGEINDALRSQFENKTWSGFVDSFGSRRKRSDLPPPPPAPRLLDREIIPISGVRSGTSGSGSGLGTGNSAGTTRPDDHDGDGETISGSGFDVQVHVERTVTVQRLPEALSLGRESYRKPRVMWER